MGYVDPDAVINVCMYEYLKLLSISLGSALVALERDTFKLTKDFLNEKIEPK